MTVNEVYYCGPVKTSHKVFFLATLEKLTNDLPEASYIFMKINMGVTGYRQLLSIGYN